MTSSRIPSLVSPRTVLIGALVNFDQRVGEPVAIALLNKALGNHLRAGGLDGMEGRVVRVALLGTPWSLGLGLESGRLVRRSAQVAETTLSVAPADAVRLACRIEDPDTLFFQRRLTIDGDVELGLYVKNALDALDYDQLPAWTSRLLGIARSHLIRDH